MQQRFVPEKTVLALTIAGLFAAGAAQAQAQDTAGADSTAATVVVTSSTP